MSHEEHLPPRHPRQVARPSATDSPQFRSDRSSESSGIPVSARVLLIDDEPADRELVERLLHRAFEGRLELIHVVGPEEWRRVIEQRDFDCVITDYRLKWSDGLALLRELREVDETPVIMLTAAGNEEVAVEAMKMGLSDYLIKTPRHLERLGSSLRQALVQASHKRAARTATRQLVARADQQAAVARLGQLALDQRDLQALLDTVVNTVATVLGSRYAKVLELLPDRQSLRVRAGVGWKPGTVGATTVAADPAGQAGFTLALAAPVVVEDFELETRFAAPPLLADHGVRSGISVPIPDADGFFGVLGVHSEAARHFTSDDVSFLVGVANLLASAIERGRLEAQLRQAQKMEGVGQLAGGVAHDFNNILTVILGQTQLLRARLAVDAELDAELAEIEHEANRAATLTRQLLAFSRRQVLRPTRVTVNRIVSGLVEMLDRLLGEDIRIETSFAADGGWVRADSGQLEQVAINLAVNARDAMPGGGTLFFDVASVDVGSDHPAVAREMPLGPYVLLTVRDTGVGMDRPTRDRAFEPFFTTKPLGAGSGLGLSMVYGIVKQSGGFVYIDSAPGEGTAVRLYFPRVETLSEARLPDDGTPAATSSCSETVLLVEDEHSVRELVRRVLVHRGYLVLQSEDGRAGLETSRAHLGPIHLLLTDVVMPGMSGLELATHLAEQRPGIKVLFTSGYAHDRGIERATDTPILDKPFSPASLLEAVRRAIDGCGPN